MGFDIADQRDAVMEQQVEAEAVLDEVVAEFFKPDILTQLAMQVELMPEEAWDLVDEDTKDALAEVL